MVAKKLRAVLGAGMTPILCVGETLEEHEQGATHPKCMGQVEAAMTGLASDDALRCVIAYEPIWAIGTGKNATPDDANSTMKVIRDHVRTGFSDEVADGIRILYGGSVKPGNIAELMAMPDIDGGLVGGASLDPDEFARVVRFGAGS